MINRGTLDRPQVDEIRSDGPIRRLCDLFGNASRVGVLVLALFLVTLLTEYHAPDARAAQNSDAPEPPTVVAVSEAEVPPASEDAKEILSKRTATSDTYLLPDGSMEARIFETPINYQAGGVWKPIREGFSEVDPSTLEDHGHNLDMSLPTTLGDSPTTVSTHDGQWISFEPRRTQEQAAEIEPDGAVSYDEFQQGAAIGYQTVPHGLKETIELKDSSAPTEFQFSLTTSPGLQAILSADGSVLFESDEEVVANLPAPTVSDAITPPQGGKATFSLVRSGKSSWNLTLTVDKAWVDSAERDWPVQVDPSVYEGTLENSSVCLLNSLRTESAGNEPCGGALLARDYPPPGVFAAFYRTLLKVPLGGIPSEASVKEATVSLYGRERGQSEANENEETFNQISGVELRRMTSAWDPPTVTWGCRSKTGSPPQCQPWTSRGGDFNAEGAALSAAGRKGGEWEWWNFSGGLASIFQSWIAGAPQYGLILKLKEEEQCPNTNEWCGISFVGPLSSEVAHRPVVRIIYYPPAPPSSRVIQPMEGTRTARLLKLQAGWRSAGVEGVTWQYREGKSGPFQTIPPELVHDGEGKSVTWPLPVGFESRESKKLFLDAAHLSSALRRKGGTVQVRALFDGPSEVAGYSAPVEAVVDRLVGGPSDATASVGPGTVDLLTGNFTTSRSDVSIPTYNSSLGFTRSYVGRRAAPNASGTEAEKKSAEELTSPLGPGWASGVPLEEAGGIVWKNLNVIEEKGSYEEVFEGETESFEYSFSYALLTTINGGQIAFEKNADGSYSVPPQVTGWSLVAEEGGLVLTDPGGTRTKFTNPGGGNEYVPTTILESAGGAATKTEIEYEFPEPGKKRLHMIVAPPPPGVSCISQSEATSHAGCKALVFNYSAATKWGAPAADGQRLSSISFYAPGTGGPWEVARYEYDTQGRLIAEWDPRLATPLKETYSYTSEGALQKIKPPGREPWTLEYATFDEEEGLGRLVSVKRPTLLSSPTTAQTTIAYDVPVAGAGAPYEMGASTVAQWGQKKDVPVGATAIFPPDQVPSARPPSSYSHATVYYFDPEGYGVNTAAPSPSGSGASISTSERDEFGNVVRELSPRNRNSVLAEPESKRLEKAEQLDTRRQFGARGTQMEEEIGPLHQVKLESGATAQARIHRVVQYDRRPEGVPLPFPDPHLPTRVTSGAWVEGSLKDERVSETEYDWKLRLPSSQITVLGVGKPNIVSSTVYNDTTGLPVEQRQPSNPGGGGAGTSKLVYYGSGAGAGCETGVFYGLLCKTEPAAQTVTPEGLPAQPKVVIKKISSFNSMDEPTETTESPAGEAGNVRRTVLTYDAIGRPTTSKTEGGGTSIPKTETVYDPTSGAATKQQFVCEGCSAKSTTTTFNAIGQATQYEDADGNVTKLTYDVDGRPVTMNDGKASQTYRYGEVSGALVKLEDSGVGTFTATYDADGNLVERGLPDGLVAKTAFNSVDQSTGLTYAKTSSCGESCTWFQETVERSVYGQVSNAASSLANNAYNYDRDGRLTESRETPVGGQCTTRLYSYDPDSNRLSRTTREPGVGGACATSGGSVQNYRYDGADRLDATGMTYDAWGRVTSLPAEFAGGKALTTSYFSDGMIASQSQNGVTNTYELDASLRQRQRVQAGGVAGTEVFHYDAPNDSVSWVSLGTAWTRYVTGIGGELAALQESSGTTTFQLTNLHGDVIAKAPSSPTATKLLATYRFNEFGEPASGSAGRFGWLGGKVRRTELTSGVLQLGARSYVPQIGRFLSTDPVAGGSANAYDYGNQDPVNQSDLEGTKPYDVEELGPCGGDLHVYSPMNGGGEIPSIGDDTYGSWYFRFKLICNASFYNIAVVKIIRTFEKVGGDPIYYKQVLPKGLGGSHFEIGNWNAPHGRRFVCLKGEEYVEKLEFLIEWHAFFPIVEREGSGPGEGGRGNLTLEAQEVCEHGPY